MTFDLNSLRRAGVSKKLAQMMLANAGGGGGSAAPVGVAKVTCSSFTTTEVTTGNGSGAPYTRCHPNLWAVGTKPMPSTIAAPGVTVSPGGSSAAFDVLESGFYTLRFSVIAGFADDAHTPPWVTYSANTYWGTRPAAGVIPMQTGALTAAFPGSGAPGSSFDVVLPTFYQPAWDSADGSYYLGIDFQWPGIGKTMSGWSVVADLARVG